MAGVVSGPSPVQGSEEETWEDGAEMRKEGEREEEEEEEERIVGEGRSGATDGVIHLHGVVDRSMLGSFSSPPPPSSPSSSSFSSLHSLPWRTCCLPSYRLRSVRSRGARLVLLWNLFSFMVYYQLGGANGESDLLNHTPHLRDYALTVLGLLFLLYPLAAWLADVWIGRSRAVRGSMVLLWALSLAGAGGLLLREAVGGGAALDSAVLPLVFCAMALGLAGFQANIVQLGVDQLQDASAEEIKAFIYWYVWTVFASGSVMLLPCGCLLGRLGVVRSLILCLALSLSLVSDFFLGHWVRVEPTTADPLRQVARVLCYGARHRSPAHRSAFTYWEDTPPSRLDLAKDKYGGPFSEEQVEDVKTFLRMVAAILSVYLFVSVNLIVGSTQYKMMSHLRGPSPHTLAGCFVYRTVAFMDTHIIVLLLPLYLLVLQPLLHKWLPTLSIFQKFGLGILLSFLSLLSLLTTDAVGYIHVTTNTTSAQCFLTEGDSAFFLDVSYYWLLVPQTLRGVSILLLFISALEFVVAQAPYSMRSILIGIIYGALGLFAALIGFILLGFSFAFRSRGSLLTHRLSCESWLMLVAVVLMAAGLVVFAVMAVRYKRRRRSEVFNHRAFIESFYSQESLQSPRASRRRSPSFRLLQESTESYT